MLSFNDNILIYLQHTSLETISLLLWIIYLIDCELFLVETNKKSTCIVSGKTCSFNFSISPLSTTSIQKSTPIVLE